MNKYFYTFGTDAKFPYQRGWVEVHAENWDEAHEKFRTKFPDRYKNCLNCAFFYDEETFKLSTMVLLKLNTMVLGERGNLGEFCHEVIE